MAQPQTRYSTIANHGYPNENEAQENDLKFNLIKLIEAFKGYK